MARKRYRSVVDFHRDLLADARAAPRTIQNFARIAAQHLMRDASALMSGTISLAELRRRGHPYARNRLKPRGVAPILPINRQSGRLRSSLRSNIYRSGNRTIVEISVHAPPYDRYVMDGTSKMLARPLRAQMEKRAKAVQRTARAITGR